MASSPARASSRTLCLVRCRVCNHDERQAIEAACDARPIAAVADEYALSESALERHVTMHERASGVRLVVDDDSIPPTVRSAGVAA